MDQEIFFAGGELLNPSLSLVLRFKALTIWTAQANYALFPRVYQRQSRSWSSAVTGVGNSLLAVLE
jgi:hypothetical protein